MSNQSINLTGYDAGATPSPTETLMTYRIVKVQPYSSQIMADGVSDIWICGEAAGATVATDSGPGLQDAPIPALGAAPMGPGTATTLLLGQGSQCFVTPQRASTNGAFWTYPPWTYEVWFRTAMSTKVQSIMVQVSANNYLQLYILANTGHIGYQIDAITTPYNTNVADGSWHHVAAVLYPNGVFQLFVDGELQGTTTGTGNTYSSSGGTDAAASWATNVHAGKTITVGSITGVIASNTGTTFTLSGAWNGGTPANGATYSLPGGTGGVAFTYETLGQWSWGSSGAKDSSVSVANIANAAFYSDTALTADQCKHHHELGTTSITSYQAQVLADGGSNLWPCDDPKSSSVIADIGPLKQPMRTPAFGGDPIAKAQGFDVYRLVKRLDEVAGMPTSLYLVGGTRGSLFPPQAVLNNVFPATGPWTLEAWFKTDASANAQVVTTMRGATDFISVGLQAGSGLFSYALGGSPWISAVNCADGNWHHMVATFASGTFKAYLDGQLQHTSTSVTFSADVVYGWAWGAGANIDSADSVAYISQAAWYSASALTATQVLDHYNRGSVPAVQSVNITDLGGLRGVLGDPEFSGTLNQGAAAVNLTLDHYPSEIPFGALVRINYPSGEIAGYWRYEGVAAKVAVDKNTYSITLSPLISEAADADFNANYSSDTGQQNPALGPATIDTAVRNALSRTQHLSPDVILNNGTFYSYAYNNGRALDALSQGIKFGGAGWWWYCDALGVVSMRNSSPHVHKWTIGKEITAGDWEDDIYSLVNGQMVTGGTPNNATQALQAFAQDMNAANPYSVPNIGRKTGQVYSDTSLMDQASVNQMAASLLGFYERVTRTRNIHLTNYTGQRPRPGDAAELLMPDVDPTLNDAIVDQGPFLITDFTEYGATRCFDVTITGDMVVGLAINNPDLAAQQALTKLQQNPYHVAVSGDGSTGSLGAGVTSGLGGGGGFSSTPSSPLGLSATSGIDNIAQTNNSYVQLTWTQSPDTDVVDGYEIRYRPAFDVAGQPTDWTSPTSYMHVNSTVVKVPGLFQGKTYIFGLRSQNVQGVFGAWTTDVSIVTALATNAPNEPTGLVAYRTPRGALVQWNGNTDPDLQGYLLQVAVNGDGFQAVNPAPNLHTSAVYTIDAATVPQDLLSNCRLVFRVAAVNWSNLQSVWSTASADIYTHGTFFDEVMTGNLTATGTITGGSITTGDSGPRVVIDNSGVTLLDGSDTNYGGGAGVSARLDSQTGGAFFSGDISASYLTSPPGIIPSAALDLTNTPQLVFFDGTYNRVLIGQYSSALTGSPDYGVQVLDSGGAAIFDSKGLINVMQLIGGGPSTAIIRNPPTALATVSCTGSVANDLGMSSTFTLVRPLTVMLQGFLTGYVGGGGGFSQASNCFIQLDGGSPSTPCAISTNISSATCMQILSLSAGSYTARWWFQDNIFSNTVNIANATIYVFQLGS